MKYFVIILILLLPIAAKAKGRSYNFSITNSTMYTKINDSNYEYVNENEQVKNPFKDSLKSLSVGVSKEFKDNWTIIINTNRLYSKEIKRSVKYKANNAILENRTRLKNDTIQVGKRFKKLLPTVFISNVEVDKSLWKDNQFLGRKVNHTILYGVNLNYFMTKHWSTSMFYVFPNEEINLESGFGLTTSFNF